MKGPADTKDVGFKVGVVCFKDSVLRERFERRKGELNTYSIPNRSEF